MSDLIQPDTPTAVGQWRTAGDDSADAVAIRDRIRRVVDDPPPPPPPGATQLGMVTQPSATADSGVPFAQQPAVRLLDADGQPVEQADVVVSASIASGGGTLGGTTTASTNASGVATFTNLSISGESGVRTLSLASAGLTGVTSSGIDVTGLVGDFAHLAPIYTLPTGMTYNADTGLVEGTVLDTTYDPPENVVTLTDQGTRAANVSALTSAINTAAAGSGAAASGTTIRLAPNADYGISNFTLPVNQSSGWIYIETGAIADELVNFPEPGTRVNYAHQGMMPKIYKVGINGIQFVPQAGNMRYRFVGLEFSFAPTGVNWGDQNNSGVNNSNTGHIAFTGSGQNDANYPIGLVVDRCLLFGLEDKNCKRLLFINGREIAVIDSRLDLCYFESPISDGQCFLSSSGIGPYKLVNNYMAQGAWGETIMFGGGAGGNAREPADIEIQRNHLDFPIAWHGIMQTKNHHETKHANRVLIQRNVFANYRGTGTGSQHFPLVLKAGFDGWDIQECHNHTVRLNWFRNCSGGVQISNANRPMSAITRLDIHANLFTPPTSNYSSVPRSWMAQHQSRHPQQRYMHNTWWITPKNDSGSSFMFNDTDPPCNAMDEHFYYDNLLVFNTNPSPLFWFRKSSESGCGGSGITAWNNAVAPGSEYIGNAHTKATTVPSGNTAVNTTDYDPETLELGATSPLKGVARGGRDPGVPHALLFSAVAGVEDES